MIIKDNKTEVPLEHYKEQFAVADPVSMAGKSGVEFKDGAFWTVFLGRPVKLLWPEMDCFYLDDGSKASASAAILFTRLVMNGVLAPKDAAMISYPQIPWGEQYRAQFFGLCNMRLARSFGNDLAAFEAAAEKIGAKKIPGADSSVEFELFPGICVRILIWKGDEEFDSSAQVLFSKNILAAFDANDVAHASIIFIDAMKGRW